MRLDLQDLGFDQGGLLLVKRALRTLPEGDSLSIYGTAPDLLVHLRGWCRSEGHALDTPGFESQVAVIRRGPDVVERWQGAERAGGPDPRDPAAVVEQPPQRWGLAARGALIEAGSPAFHFALAEKAEVWAVDAARLYAQAIAAQWDPATAIPWDEPFELPDEVENAVVQIMTYLVENETAALIVPSRFIAQLHPHFREVMQLLSVQAADEARHMEVFTRRALLKGRQLGLSTAGGQASLQTLVEEPDFATASFLLSVLGEGTFLTLLAFLERFAPDPVTAAVSRLAARDEARHVAFGMAHCRENIKADRHALGALASAVRRRHETLSHTSGLNEEVFDALVVMAAGSWDSADIRAGHASVRRLIEDMSAGRRSRLLRLGFAEEEAEELASLHTRNFM